MQIKTLAVSLLLLSALTTEAQRYFTREAKIDFFSDAAMEKIEAHNNSATSIMDVSTGGLEFAVLIKAFQFEKALMQEHFNENYMESDKFPKATFKGSILNFESVNWEEDGSYPVEVKGAMTIHGVTNEVLANGSIIINAGAISASSSFNILVADYEIIIPSVVRENIAKEVEIKVDINFQEFNR